jgi:hypothetical protein
MDYKDLSVRGLRYHLLVNDLDKESLHILKTGNIALNGIPIEAHIIGCSHAISISLLPNFKLHEVVFASSDSPGSAPLFTPKDIGCEQHLKMLDHSYLFVSFLASLDDEVVVSMGKELDKEADNEDELRLRYQFPKGPNGEEPFTGIFVSGQEEGISINTIHSYPNEGMAALTTTMIRKEA